MVKSRVTESGVKESVVTDDYAIYNADSLDVMSAMPDKSIHGSVYSPPFVGLYVYSSNERDVSNARSKDDFNEHYLMFIKELFRLTIPGRTTAVHASPIMSGNTGTDKFYDFPGEVIRLHEAAGWDWICSHHIWKEPLAIRNRTMQKNLAHKTLVTDACKCGIALQDELLIFRKPGTDPNPVQHPTGLDYYAGGTSPHTAEDLRYKNWTGDQKANRYSHQIWRRYASSIWDDIRSDRVLGRVNINGGELDARDDDDEQHVHPLQLDVIERYVQMRTMSGETVLTPFMGVGSEVYAAVSLGRKGIGIELKPAYFKQAVKNLAKVKPPTQSDDYSLFDVLESESAVSEMLKFDDDLMGVV